MLRCQAGRNAIDLNTESMFRKVMDAAPDGIMVVQNDGTIVLANAYCTKLFGYTSEELIGKPIETLVPPYIREKHVSLRDGYFSEPRTRPMGIGMPLVAAKRDGSLLPVEISLSPFIQGDKHMAVAIVLDVSELRALDHELKRHIEEIKHANAELERSNKELEQFAYVASHDLQEPLRVISGYTQLLQRRYREQLDGNAVEYIEFAVDGAKRMQNLINDLLTFSRVSLRAKAFTPVNLADVLRIASANLRTALDESHGVVESVPLPEVSGDKTQLVQLFQNLIGNSLKFRREGIAPKIKIEAQKRGDFWEFSISDNGIGIPPQYAEKIFVIFQRLHNRDMYPGTGIGLALCKKIVERHGGEIWLDQQIQEGACFRFTLVSKEH